jgi:hypothetical protein
MQCEPLKEARLFGRGEGFACPRPREKRTWGGGALLASKPAQQALCTAEVAHDEKPRTDYSGGAEMARRQPTLI